MSKFQRSSTARTIDYAKGGNVEYFRGAPLRDIQTAVSKEWGESSFFVAATRNNLECCKMIYSRCPSLLYHRSNRTNRYTAMHYAVEKGWTDFIEFLIWANDQKDYVGEETDVESEEIKNLNLLTMPDKWGWTPLHLAVKMGSVETVKMLIEADHGRDTLKAVNDMDNTPLHLAVLGESVEMVKMMIEADHGRDTLKMVNNMDNTPLHLAVLGESVEKVKMLIEADHGRDTLKMVNDAKETPLHLAVKKGNIEIVAALIEANPDLEYDVDRDGDTPLLLAIKAKSGLITELLSKKQPDKIKQIIDNGWKPIHHYVNQGDLNMVKDIIRICPSSMKEVDKEGQNCLHLAAKYKNLQLVQCIIRAKMVSSYVLNCQDIYGNTPLHVAALTGNEAIIKCLLYDKRVDKRIGNNEGDDVLDLITCDYDRAKAGLFGPTGRMTQNEWKNQSDFDLVVGALIAAVSFTAGITVPGGYISDGPNQGSAVLLKKIPFIAFVVSNNFALMFSLYAVFSHFCTRRLQREEDARHQLKVAQYCTLGAIFAMMAAFIAGSYAVLANSKPLAITGLVSCCCFFGFAFRPLCRMGMLHSVQTRIQMCWRYMSRCWKKQEIIQDNQIPKVITEG